MMLRTATNFYLCVLVKFAWEIKIKYCLKNIYPFQIAHSFKIKNPAWNTTWRSLRPFPYIDSFLIILS